MPPSVHPAPLFPTFTNKLFSKPDPDGSQFFLTPNPYYVTTHHGNHHLGHSIILVPPSGHPSLHSQILNLCNQLAAANLVRCPSSPSQTLHPAPCLLPNQPVITHLWHSPNPSPPMDTQNSLFQNPLLLVMIKMWPQFFPLPVPLAWPLFGQIWRPVPLTISTSTLFFTPPKSPPIMALTWSHFLCTIIALPSLLILISPTRAFLWRCPYALCAPPSASQVAAAFVPNKSSSLVYT